MYRRINISNNTIDAIAPFAHRELLRPIAFVPHRGLAVLSDGHRARSVREYSWNSSVHTPTNLMTTLLECSFYAPYVYFAVQSSTGNVWFIGGNDKSNQFVIVPEWVLNLLIRLEVPDTD